MATIPCSFAVKRTNLNIPLAYIHTMVYQYWDFIRAWSLIIGFIALLAAGSYFFWQSSRKSGYLNAVQDRVDEFETALSDAAWKVVLYLAMIPFMILVVIGGSTLVAINPMWGAPLIIMIISMSLLSLVYIVALPLFKLCWSVMVLGAIAINCYYRDNDPLWYYEPKYAGLDVVRPDKTHFAWMLEEPEPKKVDEL